MAIRHYGIAVTKQAYAAFVATGSDPQGDELQKQQSVAALTKPKPEPSFNSFQRFRATEGRSLTGQTFTLLPP